MCNFADAQQVNLLINRLATELAKLFGQQQPKDPQTFLLKRFSAFHAADLVLPRNLTDSKGLLKSAILQKTAIASGVQNIEPRFKAKP